MCQPWTDREEYEIFGTSTVSEQERRSLLYYKQQRQDQNKKNIMLSLWVTRPELKQRPWGPFTWGSQWGALEKGSFHVSLWNRVGPCSSFCTFTHIVLSCNFWRTVAFQKVEEKAESIGRSWFGTKHHMFTLLRKDFLLLWLLYSSLCSWI